MKIAQLSLLVPLAATTTAFVIERSLTTASTILRSQQPENQDPDELILDNSYVEQQMASLRSKYPTSEADYLAAARARAASKTESRGRAASDADWQQLAEEQKKNQGDYDDWENALEEGMNIVIMSDPSEADGKDDEPTLLL